MSSEANEKSGEIITVEGIRSRVYCIRGQQVMLDYDLADIYGYEVKNLNQQVKRNIARFPEDFIFQLTRDELISLKSQIVISREGISENYLKSQFVTLNEKNLENC
ncbi:MAG: ORF6N domain-containing protein [Lachnospiraceae bacterium]|nr:ORF6N domain-containing protein [Lachnospiraceae bacterium]